LPINANSTESISADCGTVTAAGILKETVSEYAWPGMIHGKLSTVGYNVPAGVVEKGVHWANDEEAKAPIRKSDVKIFFMIVSFKI
jgi:hypothetical protein